MLKIGRLMLVLWMCLLVPRTGLATSVLQLSFDEQAADSTAIVLAEVGNHDIIVNNGRWYTDTTLRVSRVLAGQAPALFNVRLAGGEREGQKVELPGNAKLTEGDKIVAMIRFVEGRYYLTALSQSVWYVQGDGVKATVARNLHGLSMNIRDHSGSVVPANTSPVEFSTLEELVQAAQHVEVGSAL